MKGYPSKLRWIVCGVVLLFFLYGPAYAEYLAVQATSANVRPGPGSTGPVLWRVEQYHPIEILEKKGDWYRFRDFEGDEGWISKSLVGKIPAVIIKKDKTPIRAKPDPKGDILISVDKGVPFKVISKKGPWIEIEHSDGDKGWIQEGATWP